MLSSVAYHMHYVPMSIVTAIAIHATDTYGDSLSPIRAHLKKTPKKL